MPITRPMKPADAFVDGKLLPLRYPLLCTPKIDGMRCQIVGHKALTSTHHVLPNEDTRRILEYVFPEGADGELLPDGEYDDFGNVTSAFMTVKGYTPFTFYMFDLVTDLTTPYWRRVKRMNKPRYNSSECRKLWKQHVIVLVPEIINNAKELLAYEKRCMSKYPKCDGVCMRDPDGVYKNGRSTFREHGLLRLKRFVQSEARIIGFEEMMENTNEAGVNAFGGTKRSHHQAGMKPKGTLGAFIVQRMPDGACFKLGTGDGLTMAKRQDIWNHMRQWKGKIVTYKHLACGEKDAPRLPVYLGVRDARDM